MVASKRSVMVYKAFKYRLYPFKAQQRLIDKAAEAGRQVYAVRPADTSSTS